MPSRWISLLIVALWLGAASWWFVRELAPRLDPGEPPPFTIELADQVRTQGLAISWTVYRDDQRIGLARTSVAPRGDDTYILDGTTTFTSEVASLLRAQIYLKSRYHVTSSGQLLDLAADLVIEMPPKAELPADQSETLGVTIKAHLVGQVRDQRLQPSGWVEAKWYGKQTRNPLAQQPIDLPARGSVINPMHPVNRIRDLRPGQSWRQATFDPLAAGLAALGRGMLGEPERWLQAEVLPETQPLQWDNQSVPCLVIRYRGDDDLEARTWVREKDGLVLRQDVHSGIGSWLILERNP